MASGSREENATVAALRALARGLLAHPANHGLRCRLKDDAASRHSFFHELIALVFRAILLRASEGAEISFCRLIEEGPANLDGCRIAEADFQVVLAGLPGCSEFA